MLCKHLHSALRCKPSYDPAIMVSAAAESAAAGVVAEKIELLSQDNATRVMLPDLVPLVSSSPPMIYQWQPAARVLYRDHMNSVPLVPPPPLLWRSYTVATCLKDVLCNHIAQCSFNNAHRICEHTHCALGRLRASEPSFPGRRGRGRRDGWDLALLLRVAGDHFENEKCIMDWISDCHRVGVIIFVHGRLCFPSLCELCVPLRVCACVSNAPAPLKLTTAPPSMKP